MQTPADTIDTLMQIPGFAAYEGNVFQRILDIVLDGEKLRQTGKRIGDLRYDFGLTEEIRKSREEIISVANVAAMLGAPKSTVVKGERPDFLIIMPNGPVGAEHTRAFTGYQQGSEEQLYRDVSALRNDTKFAASIANLSIILTVERSPIDRTPMEVLEDPSPQGFIQKRDVRNMVAEIRSLADSGYFHNGAGKGSNAIASPDAHTLARFHATVDVDEAMSAEHVGVQVSVRMWKPGRLSLFTECVARIADKTKKASKYPTTPDWLIIQVVAPPDVFAYDIAEHQIKSLGLFKRIFVLYWHIDGKPYLANWTADADGSIDANIPELPALDEPYDEVLHEWADAIENAMEPRRIRAWLDAGNDDDLPKRSSSPLGVQWYRKWRGRHPWVTCESNGQRIRAYFGTQGDWANRRAEDIDPYDIEGTADRIWDFIVPHAAAEPGHSV